ncbi:MAG: uroporphyrinogen decarboxylase family protein [Nitrososphaerota archaeon]|nr:uroporphyrinogen decarboxylase family protein [Nitrososphaerales archaeon]MCX8191575.1 uroporphyrinogen decarboxylase family protein [Nitrososphaerales archaeon]MDW8045239.1 uroporphyrinogen decarboxylase family protein [Nitrososphaerota archaeon]
MTNFIRINFEKAAHLQIPDQIPVSLLATGDFIIYFSNIPLNHQIEYWGRDYKRKFLLQLRLVESFPDILFLPGIWPDFNYTVEASALGCKVIFKEDAPPRVESTLKRFEDVEHLEVPDPYTDGLMPLALEAYQYMVDHLPIDLRYGYRYLEGMAVAMGPMDIASLIVGYDNLLLNLHKNPDLIHHLMKITTRTVIEWIEAQCSVTGGKRLVILFEDSISFLSKAQYLKFSNPYLKEICEKFTGSGTIIILHSCANIMHILSEIQKLPINILHYGPDITTSKVKNMLKDKICLMGGLSPYNEIIKGKPIDVIQACKRVIEEGGYNGGFILSVSGSVPVGTPIENIRAIVEASKLYGKHPSRL